MSPFVQTLLRSLQVPELEPEPEPEPEPELELEPELEVEPEPEPELEDEPVDAGGLGATELAVDTGGLAGTGFGAACSVLAEEWPLHLSGASAQMAFQSRLLKVPAGYRLGSLKSVRFMWSTSARSRLCLWTC